MMTHAELYFKREKKSTKKTKYFGAKNGKNDETLWYVKRNRTKKNEKIHLKQNFFFLRKSISFQEV